MQFKRLSLLVLATLAGGCSCPEIAIRPFHDVYFDSVLGRIPVDKIEGYHFKVDGNSFCVEPVDGTTWADCPGLSSGEYIMADGGDAVVGIRMPFNVYDNEFPSFVATRNGMTVIDSVVDLECIDHKSRCSSYRECTGGVVPDDSP